MSDYQTDTPKSGEDVAAYVKRLEAQGQREIYIRKALKAHFGLDIQAVIAACSHLKRARRLELIALRARNSQLTENRFAWKISKALTISKDDALIWAQTILSEEG